MKYTKQLIGTVLFLLFFVNISYGGSETPEVYLGISYSDRAEIMDLYAKYAHYLDARYDDKNEAQAFASVFTEDGELSYPGLRARGRKQLIEFGKSPIPEGKKLLGLHLTSNILLVQYGPGMIKGRAQVIVCVFDPASRTYNAKCGFGVYQDEFLKTPNGWKFSKRYSDSVVSIPPEFLPLVSSRL